MSALIVMRFWVQIERLGFWDLTFFCGNQRSIHGNPWNFVRILFLKIRFKKEKNEKTENKFKRGQIRGKIEKTRHKLLKWPFDISPYIWNSLCKFLLRWIWKEYSWLWNNFSVNICGVLGLRKKSVDIVIAP